MEDHRSLLEIARQTTGLDAFGGDDFREGLEILVRALRVEARLNPAGEAVLRERILGHLCQRLQVEDWYRRHPEIDAVELGRPLIGVSLPRTGSTVLSFLLAQDPAARTLTRDEAAEPCPPPGAMESSKTLAAEMTARNQAAGIRAHVPGGERAPAECQDLMALDFKSHIFQAFAQVPSYSEWLLNADLESTYAYQRRVLKLLQWRRPAQPWRLKCPTHLLFQADLHKAFPDARYVMTHRDPADVIASVIAVYVDIVGKFTDHLDTAYLAELNLSHWSTGMQRTLDFRADPNHDDRCFDIDFRAMHRDPLGQVGALYRWLGEPVSEGFSAGMEAWWQHNQATREPGSGRTLEDFGVDATRVNELFAPYNRWRELKSRAEPGATP